MCRWSNEPEPSIIQDLFPETLPVQDLETACLDLNLDSSVTSDVQGSCASLVVSRFRQLDSLGIGAAEDDPGRSSPMGERDLLREISAMMWRRDDMPGTSFFCQKILQPRRLDVRC
jgi:hypothetical protein